MILSHLRRRIRQTASFVMCRMTKSCHVYCIICIFVWEFARARKKYSYLPNCALTAFPPLLPCLRPALYLLALFLFPPPLLLRHKRMKRCFCFFREGERALPPPPHHHIHLHVFSVADADAFAPLTQKRPTSSSAREGETELGGEQFLLFLQ